MRAPLNTTMESYPELYQDPSASPPSERARIEAQNAAAEKLYRAIRYILIHDFGFDPTAPVHPGAFPGSLDLREKTQYLAIHGLLLADHYDDPTLGKQYMTSDDIVTTDENNNPINIARSFADATVSAVQEYTARAGLFSKVHGFLVQESRINPTTTRAATGSPV